MLLKNRQIVRGVELLGLVEQHPAAEREASLRALRCLDRFRDQLTPDEFTASYRRGRQLDLDRVIEALLTDLLAWQSAVAYLPAEPSVKHALLDLQLYHVAWHSRLKPLRRGASTVNLRRTKAGFVRDGARLARRQVRGEPLCESRAKLIMCS